MKKLLLITILGTLTLTLFAGSVWAEVQSSPNPSPAVNKGIKNPVAQEEVISNLKQRADKEIDRRVTSLTELITRINSMKKLSSDQKTSLTTQIQTEITALNTLKTKIDQDTDLTTLRTDVKSIVSSYRVYALYIPQIRIILSSDKISESAANLTTLAGKLESLIGTSGATGTTLTSLNNYLSDMKVKIADANTQALAAQNEVIALTPQGYPANKTTLQDARAKIKTAIKDLQTARDDAKQIIAILRSLKKPLKATSSAGLEK